MSAICSCALLLGEQGPPSVIGKVPYHTRDPDASLQLLSKKLHFKYISMYIITQRLSLDSPTIQCIFFPGSSTKNT